MAGLLSSLRRSKNSGRNRAAFLSPSRANEFSPLIQRHDVDGERRGRHGTPLDGHHSTDDNPDDSPYLERGLTGESQADEDGDEDEEITPLLPIFSAAHLDVLPVYNLTHTIRLLVVPRCETTLTWDQLRSPQVSQFLVKPIQTEIRHSHFSSATLYALLANSLQFAKECQVNPGNSGVSKTRSLVCELLAIKLLKEYTTRELIDALSYDFFPLQGSTGAGVASTPPVITRNSSRRAPPQSRAVRVSTLEIAIRAQAKHFLAHPLVVQHLEAIWAGTIVFHSAADNLHRTQPASTSKLIGADVQENARSPLPRASPDKLEPPKQRTQRQQTQPPVRRAVTLYDPRDASLFKLSRLRVPRYRQTLSTGSFAIFLALYLAVLIERSVTITTLEVVFWFWSAGFMLDELVVFNEQGLSLYIMSFWNTFDLGILGLLICFYVLRLFGLSSAADNKGHVADLAYDVLATNAVLLFPRLFSVLDHYRYFSQLLIAFRLMAIDLVAVFVLIIIACSGFFVAFTLSFGKSAYDASDVAYSLFQILLGFTPAAWNTWGDYNVLGKAILTLFLFISHFLIVTILITVLTNSFMAIAANANDEHQFVFAVNTIAMVKSDALFSYIAPTNVMAWLLAPLRFVLPFRQFVKINRSVIKVTHCPVLFGIYVYERLVLQSMAFEPTDLIDNRDRVKKRLIFNEIVGRNLFSPRSRLRQESVVGVQKDRALDEVFRLPFKDATFRQAQKSQEHQKTSTVVNNWMQGMGSDGRASPPPEQDRLVVDRLEARRLSRHRSMHRPARIGSGITDATRSVASDPEDFVSTFSHATPEPRRQHNAAVAAPMDDLIELHEDEAEVDGDGDDEMQTNDEVEEHPLDQRQDDEGVKERKAARTTADDYFSGNPRDTNSRASLLSSSLRATKQLSLVTTQPPTPAFPSSPPSPLPAKRRQSHHHRRNFSSNTVILRKSSRSRPTTPLSDSSASPPQAVSRRSPIASGSRNSPTPMPTPRSPRRTTHALSRPRPIRTQTSPRTAFQSAPNLAGLVLLDQGLAGRHGPREYSHHIRHRASSLGMDLASDIGLDAIVPSSFATQMAFATAMAAGRGAGGGRGRGSGGIPLDAGRATETDLGDGDSGVGPGEEGVMMSRLVLARMKTLEEGFAEVLEVMRALKEDGRKHGGKWKDSKGKGREQLRGGKE